MKLSRAIVSIVLVCGWGAAARSQTPAASSTAWATTSARGTVFQEPPKPEWWASFRDAELTQPCYSKDLLAQNQIAVTTNLIALYKALGGGWEVAAPGAPVQPNVPEP